MILVHRIPEYWLVQLACLRTGKSLHFSNLSARFGAGKFQNKSMMWGFYFSQCIYDHYCENKVITVLANLFAKVE